MDWIPRHRDLSTALDLMIGGRYSSLALRIVPLLRRVGWNRGWLQTRPVHGTAVGESWPAPFVIQSEAVGCIHPCPKGASMCNPRSTRACRSSVSIDTGSGSPPLLDPAETNEEASRNPYHLSGTCPGPMRTARAYMANRLADTPLRELRRMAENIRACTLGVSLNKNAAGKLAICPTYCRSRMCPVCSRQRSKRVYSQILHRLAGTRQPRMITLTLADDGRGLSERLDRLYASYRRLRQRKVWKHSVNGAVAIAEVTRGVDGDHWHTHLHIVFRGRYLPHHQLKEAWHQITGDSFIVHIGARGSREQCARYVSKYVAKGTDVTHWTKEALQTYALAMKGRRLLITSGSFHGSGIGSTSVDTGSEPPQYIISIKDLNMGHALGVRSCTDALMAMAELTDAERLWTPLRSDRPPPESVADLEERRARLLEVAEQAANDLDSWAYDEDIRTARAAMQN